MQFLRATRQVAVSIGGERHWLWCAVDQQGIVLDILAQSWRDKVAAKRLLHKLLKRQCRAPRVMVTDKLASYGAAKRGQGHPQRGTAGRSSARRRPHDAGRHVHGGRSSQFNGTV